MATQSSLRFIGRRLAALIVLLLVLSFTVFALLFAAPGSPEQSLLGANPASPEVLASIRKEYRLDEPLLKQYSLWLSDALRFDFGRSIRTSQPVSEAIGERLGLTLFLVIYAFLVAVAVGTALGVLAAVRRRTAVDRAVVGAGVVGVSAPAFAMGILLLLVFSVWLGWFPAFGPGEGFVDRLYHLTLPALALAGTVMALILKLTRAALIESLERDYVVFARARGISRPRVLLAYGLRNALIPIVTASGLVLAYLLTATVLVEVTFSLPGLGSLLIDSVAFSDIPMVQALVIVFAVAVVLVNLVTDLLYVVIDPRIRLGGSTI